MLTRKKTVIWFSVLNVLVLLAIAYFLYFGFYHWATHSVWLNASEHSFEIRGDFTFVLFLGLIVPFFLAIKTKKPLWLLQSAVIFLFCAFWKTDIVQSTLLYNQPCSTAREMGLTKSFIQEHEQTLFAKAGQLNAIMRDSLGEYESITVINANDVAYYKDTTYTIQLKDHQLLNRFKWAPIEDYFKVRGLKTNDYVVNSVAFIDKKVYRIDLSFNMVAEHSATFHYYPQGFKDEEFNMYTKYEIGTNIMVTCSREYYYSGTKWIFYLEGLCFG